MKRSNQNIFTRMLIFIIYMIGYLATLILITSALFYLLAITSKCCSAQTVFRMPMNVLETRHGGERECHNDTTVIWGFHKDTLFFVFKGKQRSFYPLNKKVLTDKNIERNKILEQKARSSYKDHERYYLLQDFRNEIYWIKIAERTGKFVIFITNIDYGIPNYVFGFNCSQCK